MLSTNSLWTVEIIFCTELGDAPELSRECSSFNTLNGSRSPFDLTTVIGWPIFVFDFTNVGAPNNSNGTSFVATATTPTAWGGGVLSYDVGAPVVTILENTISAFSP